MNFRQQNIVQLVSEYRSITVKKLSQLTGVSEVTVRQDLNALEKGGFLQRVHGSSVALESDDVGSRMRTHFAVKKALAEQAASLVGNGEVVFIEGGSTNALLAKALSHRQDVTIITVSHYIATQLRDAAADVIILGGLYQKSSESVVGPLTRLSIQHINFHKAFIGIDGWDAQTGFTGRNMLRTDVVNAVMAKNAYTVALTDSSKFGQRHPYPLVVEGSFSRVITDAGLSDELRERLAEDGLILDIVVCE